MSSTVSDPDDPSYNTLTRTVQEKQHQTVPSLLHDYPLPSNGQCSSNHVTILFPGLKVYVFFELLIFLFKNSPIYVCVFKTVFYI